MGSAFEQGKHNGAGDGARRSWGPGALLRARPQPPVEPPPKVPGSAAAKGVAPTNGLWVLYPQGHPHWSPWRGQGLGTHWALGQQCYFPLLCLPGAHSSLAWRHLQLCWSPFCSLCCQRGAVSESESSVMKEKRQLTATKGGPTGGEPCPRVSVTLPALREAELSLTQGDHLAICCRDSEPGSHCYILTSCRFLLFSDLGPSLQAVLNDGLHLNEKAAFQIAVRLAQREATLSKRRPTRRNPR